MANDQDPHAQLLKGETAALLVLDLQARLVPAMFDPPGVIRNARILLRLAELLQIPGMLTVQYVKGLGPIVPEIVQAAPEIRPFEKTSFGCFGEADFLRHLKQRAPNARSLLIAGVERRVQMPGPALGEPPAGDG